MARAVAEAIDEGGRLVVEAGTGTGKTLAYLLPALASGRKVIVSTATRYLQSQLLKGCAAGPDRSRRAAPHHRSQGTGQLPVPASA